MSVALTKNYNAIFGGNVFSSTMRLSEQYVKDNTGQTYELRYDPDTGTSAIVGHKQVQVKIGFDDEYGDLYRNEDETIVLFETTPDGGKFTEAGQGLLDSGNLLKPDGTAISEQDLRNSVGNDTTYAYNQVKKQRNSTASTDGFSTVLADDSAIQTSAKVPGTAGGATAPSEIAPDPDAREQQLPAKPTNADDASTEDQPGQNAEAGRDEENNVITQLSEKFGVDIDKLLLTTPTEEQLKAIRQKFGKSDDAIKAIAGGSGLKYPFDAIYGGSNSQDYVSISQYVYKPPGTNVIFNPDPASLLTKGAQRVSPLAELLGNVRLPMPNDVSDSNNVAWGEDSINNLSAAITSAVSTNPGGVAAGAAAGSLLSALTGIEGFGKIGALAGIFGNAGGVQGAKNVLNDSNAQMVIGSAISSRLLAMGGVNVAPEALLSRGFGVVPNMNMELLFNAPTLRQFVFNWKMAPRDENEAREINNIIRFFKQGMAAKTMTDKAGGSTLLLGTPNVFKLKFKSRTGGNPLFGDDDEIAGVGKIKECAVTGCSVNYTPEGKWSAYDDGQPSSVVMSLRMEELEPIYASDYIEGADAQERTNYSSVSLNDVGY